jgi:VanZ family protein
VSKDWAAIWSRRLAFWVFWPALIVVVWGELTPHPPRIEAPDKLLHFLAYFGLSGIATVALGRRVVVIVAVLIALGGMLEILQMFTGRDAEWLDEAANAAGAMSGALVGLLYLRLVGGRDYLAILPCEAGEVPSGCEAEGAPSVCAAAQRIHLPRFAGEDDSNSSDDALGFP